MCKGNKDDCFAGCVAIDNEAGFLTDKECFDIIEMYEKSLHSKVNVKGLDELVVNYIMTYADYEEGDLDYIGKADSLAEEILSDVQDKHLHKQAATLLSGILLCTIRFCNPNGWNYICERTRSRDGINELIYNLGTVDGDAIGKSICERVALARENVVCKELFDVLRDGIKYAVDVGGIFDEEPNEPKLTFVDIFERTIKNCKFYESEGMKKGLLNEIGVLRGIAYCMEIVGMFPCYDEESDFAQFIALQEEMKKGEWDKHRKKKAKLAGKK